MQKNNQGIHKKSRIQIIFFVTQILQWFAILFYCIFVQSLGSTIALLYLLIDIKLTFNQEYAIRIQGEALLDSEPKFKPKRYKNYLWISFILIQIGLIIFKIYYFLSHKIFFPVQIQKILELQSIASAFVPTILLIPAILIIFVKHDTKSIKQFDSPIGYYQTILLYLVLLGLLLLLQLFNICLFGLFASFLFISLSWRKQWNFIQSRWMIKLITIMSGLYIMLAFISIIFQSSAENYIIVFLGTQILQSDSIGSSFSQGFITCLGLIYLISISMDRLYTYQKMHEKYVKNLQYMAEQIKEMKALDEIELTKKRSNKEFYDQTHKISQQNQKLSRSRNLESQGNQLKRKMSRDNNNNNRIRAPSLTFFKKKSKQSTTSNINKILKEKTQSFFQKIVISIKQWNSINLFIRLLQLFSIVIIQRYNTVYSTIIILWLIFTEFFSKITYIKYSIIYVLFPMTVSNYILTYYFNIANNFISQINCGRFGCQMFGFIKLNNYWINVLIFNFFLFFMIMLVKRSRMEIQILNSQKQANKNKINQQQINIEKIPTYIEIFLALIYKYSYLIALIMLYWIGFSAINIIHLILLIIFLVFFSSGQRLIQKQKYINGKLVRLLTTFTYDYWYVIVLYTGFIILVKYIYFLFFPNNSSGWTPWILNLIGLNQVYTVYFNFSLTNVCQSNTTPFFILYIFAVLQYSVSRSKIYMQYTFSLMTMISKKEFFNKHWQFIQDLRDLFLTFYFQGLYLISGIIVLICNFKWSINGMIINTIAIYGIIFGFNKGRSWQFIMWINLIYIFGNYFLMFIALDLNELLSQDLIKSIIKFSLVVGALPQIQNINPSQYYDLHFLFIENIVVFLLSVQCNELYQKLIDKQFQYYNIQRIEKEIKQNEDKQKVQNLYIGEAILEQNPKFNQNYRVSVIHNVRKYFNVVLTDRYKWFNGLCNFLSMIITGVGLFFVLMCALYFRLCVSMFVFLSIYLVYYFVLFSQINTQLTSYSYYNKLKNQLAIFVNKLQRIYSHPQQSLYHIHQNYQSFQLLAQQSNIIILTNKLTYRKKIFPYSAIFTFICLISTYSFQFINFPLSLYPQYLNSKVIEIVGKVLFVLGISTQGPLSLWRQIYFYFFMAMVNYTERQLIIYLQGKIEKQKQKVSDKMKMNNMEEINRQVSLLNVEQLNFAEKKLINEELQQQNLYNQLEQQFISEIYQNIDQEKILAQQKPEQIKLDVIFQSNLIIFYNFNLGYMKINILFGFISILLRFYVTLLLINSYQKSNIFSWIYLIVAIIFWVKNIDFSNFYNINRISIIILFVQYLLLLFNISSQNCPYYPFDNNMSLSLIGLGLKDQNWLNYLGFTKINPNNLLSNERASVSFIINSIIIFVTQLYYGLFDKVVLYTCNQFKFLSQKYEFIQSQLKNLHFKQSIYINYEYYKPLSYKIIRKLLEFGIINSHLIICLIILEFNLYYNSILSIILLTISCAYFFLAMFSKFSHNYIHVQQYTFYYFYAYKIIAFLQIITVSVFNIPFFSDSCSNSSNKFLTNLCNQIKLWSISSQIFILFITQLWFDLQSTQQYKRLSKNYYKSFRFNQIMMSRAATYRLNNLKLKSLLNDHQQILQSQKNIKQAFRCIEQWHQITKKQYDKLEGFQSRASFLREEELKKQKEQKEQDANQYILQSVLKYIKREVNPYFYASFTSIIQDIQLYNIMLTKKINLDIQHYIIQNFQQFQIQLSQIDQHYQQLYEKLITDQQDFDQIIKQQIQKNRFQNSLVPNRTELPKILDLTQQYQEVNIYLLLFYYVLTKFDQFVTFFLIMYYADNPCLISLPILFFIFGYSIISDMNAKTLVLFYIISVVILAQIFEIYYIYQSKPLSEKLIFFFFSYQSSTNPTTVFQTSYLNFLFVILFLNKIIIKYSGFAEKFSFGIQTQYQAFIRCLINTTENREQTSKSFQEIQIHLEEYNQSINIEKHPFLSIYEQIKKNPSLLQNNEVFSIQQNLYLIRSGVDLYPVIASVQILIIIYLIFFYPLMINSNNTTTLNLSNWKFSTSMIIVILLNVCIIIIQRKITLMKSEVGKKQMIKYAFTVIKLIGILILVFFYAPYDDTASQDIYHPKPALIIYMLLECIYFTLSAYQIKLGYKKYKRLNSIMHYRDSFHSLMLTIFIAVPFLLQLKLLIDWSFSKTSLQIGNWTLLFNIYLTSFQAKINTMNAKFFRLGTPIPFLNRFTYGGIGSFIILLFIFGPMILFSNLNPTSESNLVTSGQLEIGIQIINNNYFTLYSTSHFATSPTIVNQTIFNNEHFDQVPVIRQYSYAQLNSQFQQITYFPSSDNSWQISSPNYNFLLQAINDTINNQNNSDYAFQMVVNYQLFRSLPQTIPSPAVFNYPLLTNNSYLTIQQLTSLYNTLTYCSQPTTLNNFYISLIQLDTVGTSFHPSPIKYDNGSGILSYLNNINLNLMCDNASINSSVSQASSYYWTATLNCTSPNCLDNTGIIFYVLCDKYQTLSFGYSFIGLYTSIILVVATYVRGFFTGDISLIPYNQNPRPQYILNICEAIAIMRTRQNLKQQYLMYCQLIDMMRSPEIIKYMCGSYTKMIKQQDRKQTQLEKKQKQKQKKQ